MSSRRGGTIFSQAAQEDVAAVVGVLEKKGPSLRRPQVGTIVTSRHTNMKELVIQHAGRPYRVLFAFDPRQCALLLIGGNKTGNSRWYERFVPLADDIYDRHLAELKKTQQKGVQRWLKTSKCCDKGCLRLRGGGPVKRPTTYYLRWLWTNSGKRAG